MSSMIQQGLMITVIGMGLVFVVIIFLWWLMGLLVRATTKKEVESPEEIAHIPPVDVLASPEVDGVERRRRAAAAAVAVRLAVGQNCGQGSLPEIGAMNPWQSVHRARQLEQHNTRG